MCTTCRRRHATKELNFTCCNTCSCPCNRNTIFDMLTDPCGKKIWHNFLTSIYGHANAICCPSGCCPPRCGPFPPRKCPPPAAPPKNRCNTHRVNPTRPCGFIVKPSNFPCDPGCGCCPPKCCPPIKCNCPCDPCCINAGCVRTPRGCPFPDPKWCCQGSRSVLCRPRWKDNGLQSKPLFGEGPYCLPPRSFRYKTWLSQFASKVDTNLCPSLYSSRVENAGCNMVVVNPPACESPTPCPCHPCCEC